MRGSSLIERNGRLTTSMLPVLIAVVTSAGTTYALVQTHETRITLLEQHQDKHEQLPGHAGISERIASLKEQVEKHEEADTALYTTGFGGRISALEVRTLDLERRVPSPRSGRSGAPEIEKKPDSSIANEGKP